MTEDEKRREHDKQVLVEMAARAKTYEELRDEISNLRDHFDEVYRMFSDKNVATNNGYKCTQKLLNMLNNNIMDVLTIMSIEADRIGE